MCVLSLVGLGLTGSGNAFAVGTDTGDASTIRALSQVAKYVGTDMAPLENLSSGSDRRGEGSARDEKTSRRDGRLVTDPIVPATIGGEQRQVRPGMTVQSGLAGSLSIARGAKPTGVQYSAVLHTQEAPSRIEYSLASGVQAREIGDGILFLGTNGQLLGGVRPAWAIDSVGRRVPTRLLVTGGSLVQEIDHKSGTFSYPIVADPYFESGTVDPSSIRINWNGRGSWDVHLSLTWLGRFAAGYNPDLVIGPGYRDLSLAYPREVRPATMYQQWSFHVIGSAASFTFDLEGWRRSLPNWRSTEIWAGVQAAIRSRNPQMIARACNW